MKKLICLLCVFVVMLTMTITVFAGSIPEDLLHSDDAKLYIGTVEGFSYEEIPSSPYIKVIALAVKPIEHIKGDVEIGKTITYKDTNIYMNLVEGKDYLIAYLDQHNIYAYEIKSKTNDKVTLVDSNDYDMVQRLEEYLNDGLYADAEKERSTIGLEVTLSEYMEAKIDIAEKVSFNIGGKKYNIDKDEFFKLADEIKVENVKNDVLQQTDYGENSWQENMIFITVDLKEGYTVYKDNSPSAIAAISKYGEVSHNAMYMSLLPTKDYQMEIEDVAKLYKLLPLEVSAKYVEPTTEEKIELNNRNNIIVGTSCITIVVLGVIGYFVFKKKVRSKNDENI